VHLESAHYRSQKYYGSDKLQTVTYYFPLRTRILSSLVFKCGIPWILANTYDVCWRATGFQFFEHVLRRDRVLILSYQSERQRATSRRSRLASEAILSRSNRSNSHLTCVYCVYKCWNRITTHSTKLLQKLEKGKEDKGGFIESFNNDIYRTQRAAFWYAITNMVKTAIFVAP